MLVTPKGSALLLPCRQPHQRLRCQLADCPLLLPRAVPWVPPLQSELAKALNAQVTAHDMPGFGLSTRPRGSEFYTMSFNGQAARAVMDAELAKRQRGPQLQPQATGASGDLTCGGAPEPPGPAASIGSTCGSGGVGGAGGEQGSSRSPGAQRQQEAREEETEELGSRQGVKRVLVGHSMGGAAVAEGVIASPEGIVGLVLVAPAIVALWAGPPPEAKGDAVATGAGGGVTRAALHCCSPCFDCCLKVAQCAASLCCAQQ